MHYLILPLISYNSSTRVQVHDELAAGSRPVDASVGDGARVLGGLLQLGPQSAYLRVLQPGVPGGVPEDAAELLAQIAAVVSPVSTPPVRAIAQRHGNADRGFRPAEHVQLQQRFRSTLHEPGDHRSAPEQRWQWRQRMSYRTKRPVESYAKNKNNATRMRTYS